MTEPRGSSSVRSPAAAARLEALERAMTGVVTYLDLAFDLVGSNLGHRGIDLGPLLGRSVFTFIPSEFHERARTCFERVVATGRPGEYASQAPSPGGAMTTWRNIVEPVMECGQVVGLCVLGTDMAESLARQARLANAEAQLKLAVDATGMGFWTRNLETDEGYWSEAMTAITGIAAPVDATTMIERVHPDDRATSIASNDRLIREGAFEDRVRLVVDGQIKWVHNVGRATFDDDGRPVYIAGGMLDVTEQQQLETRVRRGERLEAVGQLTAGLAHNFNNLLMALVPSLELIEPHVRSPARAHLETARTTVAQARELIRRLGTFAATPDSDAAVSSLADAVGGAVDMARGTFDRAIELHLEVVDDTAVPVSATDVGQIVLNLLLNARDAVGGFETRRPMVGVRVDRDPQGMGRVIVIDSGPGLTDEALKRAFEPLFTTRPAPGRGLGLSTSLSIAQQVGGTLSVDNRAEGGARFVLRLPAVETALPAPADTAARPAAGGRIRLLMVDDEPLIRKVVERGLSRLGFEVTLADSVLAARVLLAREAAYDVVLVDRSMPGGHGRHLVPDVRRAVPDALLVFLTGDVGSEVDRGLVDGILQKPLSMGELASALRKMLAARRARSSRVRTD